MAFVFVLQQHAPSSGSLPLLAVSFGSHVYSRQLGGYQDSVLKRRPWRMVRLLNHAPTEHEVLRYSVCELAQTETLCPHVSK